MSPSKRPRPLRRPDVPRRPRSSAPAAERALRADLVETCRRLHARDLIGAGEGNVSVRLADGTFLVTPSGANKGYLAPGDPVVVDARTGAENSVSCPRVAALGSAP